MHGIMIGPAIEVGWLDILLAQQSGYLRTMIDGVVDGLDHHNDDRSIIGPPVKMEDQIQVPPLRDCNQLFSRPFCRSEERRVGKECTCRYSGKIYRINSAE